MQHAIPDLPLRDIHLPEPISWWPPAPGWWILAILLFSIAFLVTQWMLRHRKKRAVYRAASNSLVAIRSDFQKHQDAHRLMQDLSILLRRTAMSVDSRKHAAGLTGHEWLEYLDNIAGTTCLNTDKGRQLIEAPYQASMEIDANEIYKLCQAWLRDLRNNRRRYQSSDVTEAADV